MEPNEPEAAEVEETLDLPEVEEGEEDTTDWKGEAQKLREKAIAQRERTKAKNQRIAELEKAVEAVAATKKAPTPPKTGELDETQLDYLDLKGISDQDEIDLIQNVMQRTGQTVRNALKDDYIQDKLAKLRADKQVQEATPSSTRRSGQSAGSSLELDVAKYEQSGKLPDDFERRSAVINAKVEKENTNKPAWH